MIRPRNAWPCYSRSKNQPTKGFQDTWPGKERLSLSLTIIMRQREWHVRNIVNVQLVLYLCAFGSWYVVLPWWTRVMSRRAWTCRVVHLRGWSLIQSRIRMRAGVESQWASNVEAPYGDVYIRRIGRAFSGLANSRFLKPSHHFSHGKSRSFGYSNPSEWCYSPNAPWMRRT